jgi:diguanylate cyclase (GGDEF)-like protein
MDGVLTLTPARSRWESLARRWWWGSEARTTDVLPLHMPFSRVGGAYVLVSAVLVSSTAWLLDTTPHGWFKVFVSEIVAVLLAALALRLPWRRLPDELLLVFPFLVLAPIAILPHTAGDTGSAYNNLFTLSAAYAGLTQRRLVAAIASVAMLLLYFPANGGLSNGLYIRLPVALITWCVLAVLLADLVARYSAARTQLERETEEIRRLSVQDALTGLPNRRMFETRLTDVLVQLPKNNTCCAVFFFDIDNFKDVNDGMGHAAGDALLCSIADLLTGMFRGNDVISRFGGDEFALLVEDVGDAGQAKRLGERLAAALDTSFEIGPERVATSVSVGLAVAGRGTLHEVVRDHEVELSPQTLSAARVIAAADFAMYEAKQAGGGVSRVWDAESATTHERRSKVSADLRHSLDVPVEGELWVAYQPIVELETGKVVGVEALSRWSHPVRGAVPPDEYIAAAEASGLIHQLGRQVLHTATRHLADWNRERRRVGIEPLWVSVNFSPRQLQTPDLLHDVRTALQESHLPPEQLVLEITESALIVGANLVRKRLHDLHDMGIAVALDDFGTGYSSLAYLRLLPIEIVKIDRLFVSGLGSVPADEAVVSAVTGLAQRLDQTVLAEGIETIQQHERAIELGCKYGQGFLYWPPAAAAKLDMAAITSSVWRGSPVGT